jgi:hypothetical protein
MSSDCCLYKSRGADIIYCFHSSNHKDSMFSKITSLQCPLSIMKVIFAFWSRIYVTISRINPAAPLDVYVFHSEHPYWWRLWAHQRRHIAGCSRDWLVSWGYIPWRFSQRNIRKDCRSEYPSGSILPVGFCTHISRLRRDAACPWSWSSISNAVHSFTLRHGIDRIIPNRWHSPSHSGNEDHRAISVTLVLILHACYSVKVWLWVHRRVVCISHSAYLSHR